MLKISEKYYIDADGKNMVLKEKKISLKGINKGKYVFRDIGFYNNIRNLLIRLLYKKEYDLISSKDFENTKEALVEFRKLQKEFLDEIKNMKEVK